MLLCAKQFAILIMTLKGRLYYLILKQQMGHRGTERLSNLFKVVPNSQAIIAELGFEPKSSTCTSLYHYVNLTYLKDPFRPSSHTIMDVISLAGLHGPCNLTKLSVNGPLM